MKTKYMIEKIKRLQALLKTASESDKLAIASKIEALYKELT